MKYLKKGKIAAALFVAALALVLPCAQCAYAAAALPTVDESTGGNTVLTNMSVANTQSQQDTAATIHIKSFMIWGVVLAVLAVGFIVVFNILQAGRQH